MKNIFMLFLYFTLFLWGLALFLLIQILYSFKGLFSDSPIGTILILCIIIFLFLINIYGLKKHSSSQQKHIFGGIIMLSIFGVYIFSYMNISLQKDFPSFLEYKSKNKIELLYRKDLEILNYKNIQEQLKNIESVGERKEYIQSVIKTFIQNQYEKDVYFSQNSLLRPGFFYNSEQFLEYKRQILTKIANTGYENTNFYKKQNLIGELGTFLIKREALYNVFGSEIDYVIAEKNNLLELIES